MRCGALANLGIVASLLAGLAVCQADEKQALALGTNLAAQPAAGGAQTPAPKPGAQIEKLLRAFQGTWAVNERIAPDPSTPNGATGEGSIVWLPGPEGSPRSRTISRSKALGQSPDSLSSGGMNLAAGIAPSGVTAPMPEAAFLSRTLPAGMARNWCWSRTTR
jgi:hypothetical protein